MFGVFVSLDLMLYYGFWELSLVPMAILLAMYGRGFSKFAWPDRCRSRRTRRCHALLPLHLHPIRTPACRHPLALRQDRQL